jgi:hypothetical protein
VLSVPSHFRHFLSGTSCSTPVRLSLLPVPLRSASPILASGTQLTANVQTVAGIISLLNPQGPRSASSIYGHGFAGLDDTTSGFDSGCNTDGSLPDNSDMAGSLVNCIHARTRYTRRQGNKFYVNSVTLSGVISMSRASWVKTKVLYPFEIHFPRASQNYPVSFT